MRILFLTHGFNSLTQRLYAELSERGHEVSIEFDIHDDVTIDAVRLHAPDVIVAPYLRRAIPEAVWRHHLCLVVHPGIRGDRGPSALDWAILNGEREWGVTVLQAGAEMDAGDIWAEARFPMRAARKGSLYRNEVTEAAVSAVTQALSRFERGGFVPEPLDYARTDVRGCRRPPMRQSDRVIDWQNDDTETVLRKIRSADGAPGVEDALFGRQLRLYNACEEGALRGAPGTVIARRDGAICRATRDGAVWIGHLRPIVPGELTLKLPATMVMEADLAGVPEVPVPLHASSRTYREIWYEERNGVGYLHFDFYNGAMGVAQCERLRTAYEYARTRPTRVIALMGGPDFWSNGIHLNVIEAAESPADESWRNINAMNDLARVILTTDSHLTVAALQGNAGAGGVFFALAADRVWARHGVVLNPHYKGMGNLYGSEYWTYLLPRRVGREQAHAIAENRLPVSAAQAARLGLVDDCFGEDTTGFCNRVAERAEAMARDSRIDAWLAAKRAARARDETEKPLETYRAEELEHMKLNFYGFDPSYHVARHEFVFKRLPAWTPLHLARHRHGVRESKARASALELA
ncbi:MAG: hydrogenase maturation protein [Gammaproteobacteria bacterium]|nr:MAG: hydrogenase maturation protein [Gammaproteobacteria bacterium]